MALHYLLCFGLLVLEVATFFVLIAPLPFSARRKLFHFLASPPARRVQYWLKIALVFVAVLFLDAIQKQAAAARNLYELEHADNEGGVGQAAAMASLTAAGGNGNALASKFYTQRNFYLTGFTLLLGLIHSRVFRLIFELIETQEKLYAFQTEQSETPAPTGSAAEVEAKHKQEIEVLKKQTQQQQVEYNRLSDELAKATGNVSSKRDD